MMRSVKGTRDIIDTRLWNFLLRMIRAHCEQYHFTEIITPILEHAELFRRSVGQETDIVGKEMYFVCSEHDIQDRSLCLRPEITASVMRAFLEHDIQTIPWKVFTYGPCFRHERPQKGRYREFYQISVEMIGSASPLQDVYFLTMLDRFFHEKLHLDTYALTINFLGCNDDRIRFKEVLREYLEKNIASLCAQCLERKERNILRVLDCKNTVCKSLYEKGPCVTDYLCTVCTAEWVLIQQALQQLSVSYTLMPLLVRGLDYYGKIVFEFVSVDGALGAQSTFCAGGRYDKLAQELGNTKEVPALGAALGIDRILLMLEGIQDRFFALKQQEGFLVAILPLGEHESALSLHIADMLQAKGLTVEPLLDGGSLKSMMRRADRLGAHFCVIIGPDELASHMVTVKNMKTGTEERMKQTELVDHIRAAT